MPLVIRVTAACNTSAVYFRKDECDAPFTGIGIEPCGDQGHRGQAPRAWRACVRFRAELLGIVVEVLTPGARPEVFREKVLAEAQPV